MLNAIQDVGVSTDGQAPAVASAASKSIVFLMYHELEAAGRALCQSEPGYVRYVLRTADFQAQMRYLQEIGRPGISVGSACARPSLAAVAITFDDGCQTDLSLAAPLLRELKFGATFYVTAGKIGQPGYMSAGELRELHASGFEIGCHSMTHAYLSRLDERSLQYETVGAKDRIEQILGARVRHFSCPGGRYNARVAAQVRSAGYDTMANSHTHANSATTDRYALGRVGILRHTDMRNFSRICRGEGLWKMSIRDGLRHGIRAALPTAVYEHIRAFLLKN